MKAIEVEGLSKTFRVKQKERGMGGSIRAIFHPRTEEIRAVDSVSFHVEEGEILAFIGPNGAGKSTTIKMLTGILCPDSGSARVLGIDPSKKRKQLAYEIGTVFGQKEQLWTHLTPNDNFRFFGAIYDMSDAETDRRIGELADIFDLGAFINTPVRSLSLGQRIRCEFAASLIHSPKVLFLDEPTIGLDPVVKENVRSLIKTMNRQLHTTVFLTSHDIGDIEKLCRRIIIVNNGRIVMDDSMEHVKYHYLNQKTVEVRLHGEMSLPPMQGITILKEKEGHIRFEVDTAVMKISDALRSLNLENMEDINISNIPLENIITAIYQTEGKEAAS